MTSYTPQRQALGEAFIGDTALAKNLFASPQTLDQRLLSLLQGLGQLDETLLSSAISGNDLAGLLREIHGTSQAARTAWIQSVKDVVAGFNNLPNFEAYEAPSYSGTGLVAENTPALVGGTGAGSLTTLYNSVAQFSMYGNTGVCTFSSRIGSPASSARAFSIKIGPRSPFFAFVSRLNRRYNLGGSLGIHDALSFPAVITSALAGPLFPPLTCLVVLRDEVEDFSDAVVGLGSCYLDFHYTPDDSGSPPRAVTYAELWDIWNGVFSVHFTALGLLT